MANYEIRDGIESFRKLLNYSTLRSMRGVSKHKLIDSIYEKVMKLDS